MDFKTYQDRLSQLSSRFNLMVSLVFILLISNLILASLVYHTTLNQRIEITPFFKNESYVKNLKNVDAHYLTLMAENFIYLRLNVSPQTISFNHKQLLDCRPSQG